MDSLERKLKVLGYEINKVTNYCYVCYNKKGKLIVCECRNGDTKVIYNENCEYYCVSLDINGRGVQVQTSTRQSDTLYIPETGYERGLIACVGENGLRVKIYEDRIEVVYYDKDNIRVEKTFSNLNILIDVRRVWAVKEESTCAIFVEHHNGIRTYEINLEKDEIFDYMEYMDVVERISYVDRVAPMMDMRYKYSLEEFESI